MPNPNFFIVGGPKCGTTSLYEILRRHPDVFMPDIKEPLYFGTDLTFDLELCARNTIQHRENYLALFQKATRFARIGEASPWYLYSSRAAKEIYDFDPTAKIIIMLRNPIDLMYSLHGDFVWNCNENLVDFSQAIEAQEDRRQGRQLAETTYFPQGLQYEEVVSFADQVQRYFDVWGRQNVHIVILDDYTNDSDVVMKGVAGYLGIDPEQLPPSRIYNFSKPTSMAGVNRFFARRRNLRRAINRVVPMRINRRMRDIISKLFASTDRTRSLDKDLRRKLQQRMLPEVKRLSDVLDRDLTHWCEPIS